MEARSAVAPTGFIRVTGAALASGGLLAALLNLILTPQLPTDGGSVAVATSTAFGIRMPLAAASVALVTLGLVGLYLAQAHRMRWGSVWFLISGLGGMTTFCIECVQFTLVRDLAFNAPETLERLEEAGQLARYDLGFAIGAAIFFVGWIGVAIVTWRIGLLNRRGSIALLAGMLLALGLGVSVGIWGAVVGNAVLGAGWILLGLDLRRAIGEP